MDIRPMWRSSALFALLAALLVACGNAPPAHTPPAAGPWADVHAPSVVVDWPLPSLRPGTHSPGLVPTSDGRLLLSWINSQRGRRHVLQFSAYDLGLQRWRGAPLTAVIGQSLFINPADAPRMTASRDGSLWVQWLQTLEQGTPPALMLSHSRDGGANWSEPHRLPSDPASPASAFASLWPEGAHGIGMAWLGFEDEARTGLLQTGGIEAGWSFRPPMTVDDAVDCAAPSAILTPHGPLLAWRRLSADGVRDIWLSRRHADGWSPPQGLQADHGRFSNCPISGPALGAHGESVVIAWASADTAPETVIQMALSTDAGATFGPPLEMARGSITPIAVALDTQQVWLMWQQVEAAGGQSLWLSRRSLDLYTEYERRELARTSASGFTSINGMMTLASDLGLPQFALHNGQGYLVWTVPSDNATSLRAVKIQPPM